MKRIWQADDKFVREMQNDTHEPMAPIAGALIKTKEQLERSGLRSSKRFSGFGVKEDEEELANDPVQRLRELAIEGHKKVKRKLQRGRFLPVAPLLTAAGGTLVSKIVSDVYDLIKKEDKRKRL